MTITVDANGSVDSSLPGSYPENSVVALYAHLATQDSGYIFNGFINENNDPIDSVLMSDNCQVKAVFINESEAIPTVNEWGMLPFWPDMVFFHKEDADGLTVED